MLNAGNLSSCRRNTSVGMQDVDAAAPSEVVAFQASEAYVYSIPSATTVGHRAETWNVNEWLQQVRVAVVTRDEDAWVRLEDPESGECQGQRVRESTDDIYRSC